MSFEPIIELKGISKTFKSPQSHDIFTNINLTIAPGETVAITGDSGVGKSTLLHILGLLEPPTSGEILFNGKKVLAKDQEKLRQKEIGFIFQGFYLLEEESSLNNVLLPAKVARMPIHPASCAYERGLDLLGDVNLLNRAQYPARLLSGGEKQRIAIARALCNDPQLILADEPTGNLDSNHSKMIEELLFSCCKKHEKSLILVTHDLSFADQCDRHLKLTSEGIYEHTARV